MLTLAAALIAGCSASTPPPAHGRVVVALTIDWEGADLAEEDLDALDELRQTLGGVPLTHFVSPAYFTKQSPDPGALDTLTRAVHTGDELAVHLHAWRSLAKASGVEPKLSPSFLTGTDEVLAFEDGDAGFDTDLDVYTVAELRAILRTSRALLQQTWIPISNTFRAGGYLATPKVMQAIHDEGFTVDSSAIDDRHLDQPIDNPWPMRLEEIWPAAKTKTRPFFVETPSGPLLEMPIGAIADYATTEEIATVLDRAHAELEKTPDRDVFVVLGFHLETASSFARRLTDALEAIRGRRGALVQEMVFVTVEKAAELGAPPRPPT